MLLELTTESGSKYLMDVINKKIACIRVGDQGEPEWRPYWDTRNGRPGSRLTIIWGYDVSEAEPDDPLHYRMTITSPVVEAILT